MSFSVELFVDFGAMIVLRWKIRLLNGRPKTQQNFNFAPGRRLATVQTEERLTRHGYFDLKGWSISCSMLKHITIFSMSFLIDRTHLDNYRERARFRVCKSMF